MADSASVTQVVQIGVETTPGTPVAATKRLPNFKIIMSPDGNFSEYRSSGSVFIENVFPGEELSTGTSQGGMSFTDVVYPWSSVIGYAAPAGATITGYTWTFTPLALGGDTYKVYTLEKGDASNGFRFSYVVWAGFGMKFSKKEASHSGNLLGQAMGVNAITGSVGAAAKQVIVPRKVELYWATSMANLQSSYTLFLGAASGGNFTLTYGGVTTANITFNAAASAVKSALETISTVGSGNSTVTGAAGGPYTITLAAGFNGALTATAVALTGGTLQLVGATAGFIVTVGGASAGNFKLTFNGQQTADIAYNAAASAVKTALEALSTVGSGNSTVTGTGPYQIVLAPNLMSSGNAITIQNGTGITAATLAVAGPTAPTKVSRLFELEFKIANRFVPVYQMDANDQSFCTIVQDEPDVSLMLKLGAQTVGTDFMEPVTLSDARNATINYFRVQAYGPTIAGVTNSRVYAFWLDMAAVINNPLKLEDVNKVQGVGAEYRVVNDSAAGYPFKITVANEIAGL